jgi:hypothetical protein
MSKAPLLAASLRALLDVGEGCAGALFGWVRSTLTTSRFFMHVARTRAL